MKKKNVAGFLALFLGVFGVHRFYLGQRFLGILYMMITFFAVIISAEENVPAVMAPAILGLVDAVLFFVMPREDFDRRYNKTADRGWYGRHYRNADRFPAPRRRRRVHASEFEVIKRRGIQNFRDYHFEAAAEDFEQALSLEPENAAIHYNLAATYAMLEEETLAFQHLEEAVACGFDQVEKIHSHDALAYLRSRSDFQAFVDNGYRMPALKLEDPEEELELGSEQPPASRPAGASEKGQAPPKLLEQIAELGKLRDRGILTEEEFAQQKEKILMKRSG